MMKNLDELINELDMADIIEDVIAYCIDNNWFNEEITVKDSHIMLTESQATLFRKKITRFAKADVNDLKALFKKKFPITAKHFSDFVKDADTTPDEDAVYHLTDFMLFSLRKELPLYDNDELESLLHKVTFDLIKAHGDIFTFFAAWIRAKRKSVYTKDHILNKRYTMDHLSEAYDFDEYIRLAYYLFDEEYVEDNEMFVKAANSKNFTDTWLYLALHFIRPLRLTDLERIYHPLLPYGAQEVIDRIRDGTFTDNDAKHVLVSITKRMEWLALEPNKTKDSSNVPKISFDIPVSCEAFLGKLFALAQAHRYLLGRSSEPIVRKVSTYQEINRYMGDDIGSLFLKNDFRSRSATKSYLQDICMIADETSDESGLHVKGYFIAAYARSHKGDYKDFAATTFQYLKDIQFANYKPEFVAFELLERGVFSSLATMLLQMALGDRYKNLRPDEKTDVINTMDLSPKEIESLVTVMDKSRKIARNTLNELITEGTDILAVLHRIGSGEAFSKQHECLCLLSAVQKVCPYGHKNNCVGCRYEISTRSTFLLMIEEYNRMKVLKFNVKDELEKNKYEKLVNTVLLPKIGEMLTAIREQYGEKAYNDYAELLKENT